MPTVTKETEKTSADMFIDGFKPIWPNLIRREYRHTYEYVTHMRRANRILCECARDGVAGMSHYYNSRGDIELRVLSIAQIFSLAFSDI